MAVGDLAAEAGVSTRSLRYYEQQGLIDSERTPAGHRRFRPEMVERVILIQHLFAAGLSGAVIGPLLPCMLDESQRTDFLVDELRRQSEALKRSIRERQETARILDEVIAEYDDVS